MPGLEPFSQFAKSYGITNGNTINGVADLRKRGVEKYNEAYEDAKKAYAESHGLKSDFSETDQQSNEIDISFNAQQRERIENFVTYNFEAIAALDGTSGLSQKDLQLLDEQSKTGVMIAKSNQAFGDLAQKPITNLKDAQARWNSNIKDPNGEFNKYAFSEFGLDSEPAFKSVMSADGNPNDLSNQDLMLVQAQYYLKAAKTKEMTGTSVKDAEAKAADAEQKAAQKEKAAEVSENQAKAAEEQRDNDKPIIASSNLSEKKKKEYTEKAEGYATEARNKANDLKAEATKLRAEATKLRIEANQTKQAADQAKLIKGVQIVIPSPDVKSASLNNK